MPEVTDSAWPFERTVPRRHRRYRDGACAGDHARTSRLSGRL